MEVASGTSRGWNMNGVYGGAKGCYAVCAPSTRVSMAKRLVSPTEDPVPAGLVEQKIYVIRGHKVMLDADLAELYEVPVKRLNEAVRRNLNRFPRDFMFQLSGAELQDLRSQIATSSWGGRR